MDRTLIAGFYDDVAIRVSGDDATSRVDIRSASRFGSADLGRNAERIRAIMHEITMRVQATMPMADDEKAERSKRGAQRVKRGKALIPSRKAVADHKTALNKVLDVGLHRRGLAAVARRAVERQVDDGTMAWMVRDAVLDGGEDRLLAPLAVQEIGLHGALRLVEAISVPRQIDGRRGAASSSCERADVVGHGAFGRRDERRVPGHHVVAREQDRPAREREAQMIRRVTRRVERGRGAIPCLRSRRGHRA